MKTTKKIHSDGSETSTNYMLDDVIEAFNKHADGIDVPFGANDELIKEITIQKIEYGRHCFAELLLQGGQTLQTMTAYFEKIDAILQKKITEVKNLKT